MTCGPTASRLSSRGFGNLTHRESDERPEPLVPGERYVVDVILNSIAYRLPAGHRLRLTVSPSYWPWIWPSPAPVTLTVYLGGVSALELPLWTAGGEHLPPAHFAVPERAPMPAHEALASLATRETRHDVASGVTETISTASDGHRLVDDGLEYKEGERDTYRIKEGQPLSAQVRCEREMSVARGEWRTTVRTESSMSATADAFLVSNVVDAYEGDVRVFSKSWHATIPRNGV